VAIYLGDINTRARGLRTRLLRSQDLDRLAHARSLFVVHRELSALGVIPREAAVTPAGLEQAIRRRAAELMGILGRWCADDRLPVFAVVLEDEDRRSIQSILRGAEQGASSEARLSGLIPTTSLPERALTTLAAQPTMADVVRMLVLWSHPLGRPLVAAAGGSRPSLFEVEVELQRAFASRALADARKAGPHLVEYVRQVVDVMNAWSALLHFPERDSAIVDLAFVEGGTWIDKDVFAGLISLPSLEDVYRGLGRALRESPLSAAFVGDLTELATLETAVLRAQVSEQRRAARANPESAAPFMSFALELRAEVLNLRRIIWGVALGAPAGLLEAEMVTA
jgi:vacuolar-type H+-ATPase subunit C/Vma6